MNRVLTSLILAFFLWNAFPYMLQVNGAHANSSQSQTLRSTNKSFTKNTEGILFINEIMESIQNVEGRIELYNNSDMTLNLAGYYLSNEMNNLKKWKFPDVTIGPRELLTLWSSDGNINNPLGRITMHILGAGIKKIYQRLNTNIKISMKTNPLLLTAPDGLTVIDRLDPVNIPEGQSYGRYPDGGRWKNFVIPTPDGSNNNMDLTNIPGKPGIAITWDDDSIEQWHNLLSFDWFQNTRNTFCLTQAYRQTDERWEMLRDLKRHGHEIACHGYNHESSVDYVNKYGLESYINDEVIRPVQLMASQDLLPDTFAYPNGVRNSLTDNALLNYFKVIRKTSYSPYGDPFEWGSTKVIPANGMDLNYRYKLEDYFKWLEKAREKNQVVVLYGHTPTPELKGDYRTPHQRIEAIINKAKNLGLTFYTLSDLSKDMGTLKIVFSSGYSDKTEWTLDRKQWHKGGESLILPAGSYSVMFRNIGSSSIMAVDIQKNKLREITVN